MRDQGGCTEGQLKWMLLGLHNEMPLCVCEQDLRGKQQNRLLVSALQNDP